METAKKKYDTDTVAEGKKRGLSMERSKVDTKDQRSPGGLSITAQLNECHSFHTKN